MDIIWAEFIKEEIAINCISKEDSDIFLNYCFSNNVYWGHELKEFDQWEWNEEETCYSVYEGRLQYSDKQTEKRIIVFSHDTIEIIKKAD